MRRAGPRPLQAALERQVRALAPATTLAGVQGAWERAAGPAVTAEAEPVEERAGVVTVVCSSAVWAHELRLLEGELRGRLNAELEAAGGSAAVRELRFTAARSARPRR
jgi:predicted nucleic acid-binding Zn ribbon protein